MDFSQASIALYTIDTPLEYAPNPQWRALAMRATSASSGCGERVAGELPLWHGIVSRACADGSDCTPTPVPPLDQPPLPTAFDTARQSSSQASVLATTYQPTTPIPYSLMRRRHGRPGAPLQLARKAEAAPMPRRRRSTQKRLIRIEASLDSRKLPHRHGLPRVTVERRKKLGT